MTQQSLLGWHRIAYVLVMLASTHAPGALGQLTTGEKPPEALKDIKVAGGVCRRDDVSIGPGGVLASAEVQPDLECAITVSEFKSLLLRPEVALIDLRSSAEYQAFHIENAINTNMTALQSKPYWRSKTLILIGNGKAERENYANCTRLRQSGYKQVRVLRGGMLSWLAQNQVITGRATSPQQLAHLTDAEFVLESRDRNSLVVLGREDAAMQAELPFSLVSTQMNEVAIKALIERRRKTARSEKLMSLIVVPNPANTYEQIAKIQQAISPVTLLVYAQGRDAFMRQIALQKAIWSAHTRGPKQPRCGL